ncbi:UNVERIFIED_CONTAM: hypothetical protein K2H54_035754 [Gekko kuhli]
MIFFGKVSHIIPSSLCNFMTVSALQAASGDLKALNYINQDLGGINRAAMAPLWRSPKSSGSYIVSQTEKAEAGTLEFGHSRKLPHCASVVELALYTLIAALDDWCKHLITC